MSHGQVQKTCATRLFRTVSQYQEKAGDRHDLPEGHEAQHICGQQYALHTKNEQCRQRIYIREIVGSCIFLKIRNGVQARQNANETQHCKEDGSKTIQCETHVKKELLQLLWQNHSFLTSNHKGSSNQPNNICRH